jgi:hypothetical protein
VHGRKNIIVKSEQWQQQHKRGNQNPISMNRVIVMP